jgi:hypothetical protein
MTAIVTGDADQKSRFFRATHSWTHRHNYMDGELISSSGPLDGPATQIVLNEKVTECSEIVRTIAIAAGVRLFEEFRQY